MQRWLIPSLDWQQRNLHGNAKGGQVEETPKGFPTNGRRTCGISPHSEACKIQIALLRKWRIEFYVEGLLGFLESMKILIMRRPCGRLGLGSLPQFLKVWKPTVLNFKTLFKYFFSYSILASSWFSSLGIVQWYVAIFAYWVLQVHILLLTVMAILQSAHPQHHSYHEQLL